MLKGVVDGELLDWLLPNVSHLEKYNAIQLHFYVVRDLTNNICLSFSHSWLTLLVPIEGRGFIAKELQKPQHT